MCVQLRLFDLLFDKTSYRCSFSYVSYLCAERTREKEKTGGQVRWRVVYGLPKVKIKRSEGMGGVEVCSRVTSKMVGVVRTWEVVREGCGGVHSQWWSST